MLDEIEKPLHHSSLTGGGEVPATGTIQIKNGVIQHIDASGGHYKTPPFDFLQVLERLDAMGASLEKADVEFYDDGLRPQLLDPFGKTGQ